MHLFILPILLNHLWQEFPSPSLKTYLHCTPTPLHHTCCLRWLARENTSVKTNQSDCLFANASTIPHKTQIISDLRAVKAKPGTVYPACCSQLRFYGCKWDQKRAELIQLPETIADCGHKMAVI